jgi:hypothetical protein
MANAKQKLSKVIREIVQQEVEKQLVEIFGNKKKESAQQAQDTMIEQYNANDVSYTKNASLNEALNATAKDDGFKTMKKFDSADARGKFAQMQGGAPTVESMVPRDLAHKPVDAAVEKALTRDYTELVKRFKK